MHFLGVARETTRCLSPVSRRRVLSGVVNLRLPTCRLHLSRAASSSSTRTELNPGDSLVASAYQNQVIVPPSVQVARPRDYDGVVETSVLFVHAGAPDSEADVTRYFTELLHSYYQFAPRSLIRKYVNSWRQKQLVKGRQLSFPDEADKQHQLADRVRLSLQQLVPEFAPFSCLFAYRLTEPTIHDVVYRIQSQSPRRVLVVPFYANYWCFQSNLCFNQVTKALAASSSAADRRELRLRRAFESGKPGAFTSTRPAKWSLVDRLSSHPFVADLWAQRIQHTIASQFPFDAHAYVGIVFAVPLTRGWHSVAYKQDVLAGCQRISAALSHAHPSTIATYNAWDQPFISWPNSQSSLLYQMRRLTSQGVRNIVIVPITHLLPNELEATALMPSNKMLKLLGCEQVAVAHGASGDGSQSTLAHGLMELVKNHLLSEQPEPTGQFRLKCPWCVKRVCRDTRALFCSDPSRLDFG